MRTLALHCMPCAIQHMCACSVESHYDIAYCAPVAPLSDICMDTCAFVSQQKLARKDPVMQLSTVATVISRESHSIEVAVASY